MVALTAYLASMGFAALAAAQTPLRPGIVTCEGREWPDWDACEPLRAIFIEGTVHGPLDGECIFADYDGEHNCRMRLCWPTDPHVRATAHWIDINAAYDRIKRECEPIAAGGYVEYHLVLENSPLAWQMVLVNDPAYTGSSAIAASDFDSKKLLAELADSSEVTEDNIHLYRLTHENMQAYIDAEAAELASIEHEPVALPAEESEISLTKRQEDPYFMVVSQAFAVINQNERTVAGPVLGPGAEYDWTVTESTSVGISVSAGLSVGFWEIFTASFEVEVSMDYEVSYSETYSFTSGNCERGQNYFYPLFDLVRGWMSDESPDDIIEVWIPRGGDNIESPTLEYAILTECLGRLE